MLDLREPLKRYFGFESFRGGQEQIIQSLLEGEHVLGIMTTGAGKSLCYQLPALLMPGVTLVISPLVALMHDQVEALSRRGIDEATYLNSLLSPQELKNRLAGIRHGAFKLVYIAPERLRSQEFLQLLQDIPVSMLVVDEAHCISEWGHDFRTDYLQIGSVREKLGHVPVLALTATATPEVQEDILIQLRIVNCRKFVTGFDRPNLALVFRREETKEAKYRAAFSFLQKQEGVGIVYAPSRNECEEVARYLRMAMPNETIAFYHAGLRPEERRMVQDEFMAGRVRIVVATNAFGMGIDKPDIRYVVHLHVPASVEGYYQEAGRAGRDGLPSVCMTIYNEQDRAIHHYFLKREFPTEQEYDTAFELMRLHSSEGGVFRGSWREMTRWPGLDDDRLSLLVHQWENIGAMEVLDFTGDGVIFRLDIERMRSRKSDVLTAIERLKLRRFGKLNRVMELLHSPLCRREGVLGYFGQALTERPRVCCDICNPEMAKNPSLVEVTLGALNWGRVLGDLFPEEKLDPRIGEPLRLAMTAGEEAYRVGQQGKADELPRLYEMLNSPSVTTRRMACSAIGKIGRAESVPYLLPRLEDSNPQVRQYALKALAKMDDRRWVGPVWDLLRREDKEYNIRQAKIMLEQMGERVQ
ncbi:RecQ family ATP-dependent DNA helicase [Tumebacillus sp. ITR2]|uniref:ATP-dependent DNA helicase RecQ n=1 Tax=Tumebacillus amylolyticus TaxID=2801339 RepID=A0ABS1J6Z6_9BACL|nr:RecQ family ATP-dependent DNA helicase [Tumebacillus amylolyticus]MBL0385980.1 RecQ family ATP-dependent DNA helicase [Tumebacillus amylolyticus]